MDSFAGLPLERLRSLRKKLDPARLPETVALLDGLNLEEDVFTPYEFAGKIAECDKAVGMPRVLFDYLVDLYKIAIEDGEDDAMNDLGALYYDGRGCEQDFQKAVYYYDMAATNGNRQAQENLGYCYYYGRNMPVDYEKAFHYFALGAFDGHLISLYKIGDMYLNGYYVEKNPKEAFRIYERCFETMTDHAAPVVAGPVLLRLGNCFLDGVGTEENAKNALVCYQRAEGYLFDMVAGGDVMYKKSWMAAIEGQAKARDKLAVSLPKREWTHD